LCLPLRAILFHIHCTASIASSPAKHRVCPVSTRVNETLDRPCPTARTAKGHPRSRPRAVLVLFRQPSLAPWICLSAGTIPTHTKAESAKCHTCSIHES
ncbi:hypothetical protein BC828DRAFT_384469, partial [Blastocladiella britannica]